MENQLLLQKKWRISYIKNPKIGGMKLAEEGREMFSANTEERRKLGFTCEDPILHNSSHVSI